MNSKALHSSPTGVLAILLGTIMVAWLVRAILVTNTERVVVLQPVALVATAPPPPPREVPKPPEPQPQPMERLDAKSWTAEGATDSPPGPGGGPVTADGPLGLAEAGEGGADAFGLAGRPGGTALLLSGGGGGGGGAGRFVHFAKQLESHVQQEISRQDSLRKACYSVNVTVRLTPTGAIQEVKILSSTGRGALDTEIKRALESLPPMDPAPPADMPWPVGLEIVSRRNDCPGENASAAGPGR